MPSPVLVRRSAAAAALLFGVAASAAMAGPATATPVHPDAIVRPQISGVAGYANVDVSTIDPASAYNSSGGAVTVSNPTPGSYTVDFHGLASNGGVAQVSSYGLGVSENKSCSLNEWIPSGADELVLVSCFAVDTPYPADDSTFGVSFTAPTAVSKMAYIWANQPTSSSYTPALPWNFDSKGGPNTVTRIGPGQYAVIVPHLGSNGGTVQVSAYGTDAKTCAALNWYPSPSNAADLQVNVRCLTPVGVGVDSYFAMSYVQKNDILGQSVVGGYLEDNKPTTAFQTITGSKTYASGGAPSPTVSRSSVGVYQITMPNVPDGGSSNRGVAMVTPVGLTGGAYCVIPGYGHNVSGAVIAEVDCFSTVNPVDLRFTFQYVRHL